MGCEIVPEAVLTAYTSEKLMVALRDGRKLIGVLRSWDQFGVYKVDNGCRRRSNARAANLILQSTTERIFATLPDVDGPRGVFADVSHGIFLVRGENVLLLGEIDLDKDDEPPPGYEPAELDVVKKLADEKKAIDKAKDKSRLKKLSKLGFEGENLGEILF